MLSVGLLPTSAPALYGITPSLKRRQTMGSKSDGQMQSAARLGCLQPSPLASYSWPAARGDSGCRSRLVIQTD